MHYQCGYKTKSQQINGGFLQPLKNLYFTTYFNESMFKVFF